jgi:hypothetical protein
VPDGKQKEIDRNFEFFQQKLPELMTEHRGKFALIRNREIVGFYDTAIDAQTTGEKFFNDGIFSIQQVTDKPIDLGFFSHAVYLGAA